MHRAGVDENDLACRGSPEATAFVDKPLVDEHLHGLRLIRHRFASHSASSSSSLSFSILSSLLATYLRLCLSTPFSAYQNSSQFSHFQGHVVNDYLPHLAQFLGPL